MTLFKPFSTHDCELQLNRVDVWQFSLRDEPQWAYDLLQDDEKQRANRYHFPKHQRRFTVARALLRLILANYLHQDPQKLILTANTHGKPFVCNKYMTDEEETSNNAPPTPPASPLQFNLSHSKDTALLAITPQHELGIDLEYYSDRPFLGIAQHVFSEEEIQAVTNSPSSVQAQTFFTIWAQKEAFIKAVGMGLAYPLKQFSVPTVPGSDIELFDPLTQTPWRLLSVPLYPDCEAALCINPNTQQLRWTTLETLDDLSDFYTAQRCS